MFFFLISQYSSRINFLSIYMCVLYVIILQTQIEWYLPIMWKYIFDLRPESNHELQPLY